MLACFFPSLFSFPPLLSFLFFCSLPLSFYLLSPHLLSSCSPLFFSSPPYCCQSPGRYSVLPLSSKPPPAPLGRLSAVAYSLFPASLSSLVTAHRVHPHSSFPSPSLPLLSSPPVLHHHRSLDLSPHHPLHSIFHLLLMETRVFAAPHLSTPLLRPAAL